MGQTTGTSLGASMLIMVASVLIFVFLTQLPTGRWWQRILYELLMFAGSGMLVYIGLAWMNMVGIDSMESINDQLFTFFIPLAIFSHVAIRIFARPYVVWGQMRKRRLVWDITHAQLRLVILTMVVLFALLIILQLASFNYDTQSSDYITTMITLFIAMAGFFGILTGIMLFIVIIPASFISYNTARRITQRLDELVAVTQSIRNADYDARVTVEGIDEIARLQTNFNAMMDELDTARQQLEAERDAVRQLLNSRRRLFADVSHELRTPVATIRGYLDSLNIQANTADDIEIIKRETLRLQRLIDDVFTLARADVDQLQYSIQVMDITGILEHTKQAVRKQAWQSRKVDIVLDYTPQIPLVMVDEERLEQVLYNLLRNAVRHTPPGGFIRMIVSATAAHVRIDVQDTGEGIAAADLPYIWDRFYRAAETRAHDPGGSGLGLALVKEMVEAMHGTVGVTSTVGRGSCFTIKLRRAQAQLNESTSTLSEHISGNQLPGQNSDQISMAANAEM
ncbi:HAMP domain-containing protein [Phototrophicus methaneseepsis]|uniref:histidine kinase n=1 Tax=Phototrophicus methaneseepsis TaxID=2710758 RepID=A0A7S8IFQ2_9CHLR|nr:HAMP domain-containing sensor histidine kinase [Phototrophicus methaneseepsis]QPC83714.1 HAMP domain-containing protein [Phototrophicus methaneseepsis]